MGNEDIQIVLEKAKTYQAEMTSFLQDLVRIPSVNGRDTEKVVAERIVAEGKKRDFKAN